MYLNEGIVVYYRIAYALLVILEVQKLSFSFMKYRKI